MNFENIVVDITKGILLALVYFEITKANDSTFESIGLFTGLYVIMTNFARLSDIETSIVTNAFITKAVFTLVDERIKKKTN
jgi:hypothetical protein